MVRLAAEVHAAAAANQRPSNPSRSVVLSKGRHIPERSCVSCGQKMPKRELVRIVRTPHGDVTVDPNGKEAGRGAYLCASPACWQKGIEKGALERSLKRSLSPRDRAQLMTFYRQVVPGSLVEEQ